MKYQVGLHSMLPEESSPAFHFWLQEGDRLYREHMEPEEPENCLDLALNEYARALEENPTSIDVLCRMGKVFLKQGHYAKAEQYAHKCLKLLNKPSEEGDKGKLPQAGYIRQEAHYILGSTHYRKGEQAIARKHYMQSIRHGGLGSSRSRFGLFQSCREQLSQIPFRAESVTMGVQAIYSLFSSLCLFLFDRDRIALPTLLVLFSRLLMAWTQEELGRNDAALDRYLNIHQDYPGLCSVSIIIADLYREKGQTEKAQYWLEKAIAKHPGRLEAYYHLARLMEEKEDYSGMVNVYHRLIRLKPADAHLYCNLANAHYYNNAFKDALHQYETALQLGTEPRWKAMVAQSIANIYCDYLQNSQAALAYYQMAKALDPSEIENYIQLGMLYFNQEDFANAEVIYRQAIHVAPDNPRLYSNLGYLRWMEGDVEVALTYYEKAIALDSEYEIPINNMGVIYLDMLGNVEKAIELFNRAIEIDEHYALAYYNLGRAYSFLDNRLEAANCFRTAQELNHYSCELDNDELTARINHLFDTCEMELRD